ncbi:MAG: hypothetical protein LBU65_09345 [Planctomycetaceae bacterium]|jgi:DNA-binding response OmpR family regulator|nr:hypothetical protein [Planctomycetaceae bacterium]
MNPRLFKIWNDIDTHLQAINALQNEERTIIQSSIPIKERPEISLNFDDQKRTIDWNGGSICLTPKQYILVRLLWNSENHRASIAKIERQVWLAGTKKKTFVDIHTIEMCISRTKTALKSANFPYKIKTIKIFPTREIKGYQLVCEKITKKCYKE